MKIVIEDPIPSGPGKFDYVLLYNDKTGERIAEWTRDWPWPTRETHDRYSGETFNLHWNGEYFELP